jgi:predicted RNA-binding Zn-ribbon protein involved in translation (DUF1610 family)
MPAKDSLILCAECGHQVHNEATKCPHCGTSQFRYLQCFICRLNLKPSASLSAPYAGVSGTYHVECFRRFVVAAFGVKPDFLACPSCGFRVPLSNPLFTLVHAACESNSSEGLVAAWGTIANIQSVLTVSCPQCGNPDVVGAVGRCNHCFLPVIGRDYRKTHNDNEYDKAPHHYYHSLCVPYSNLGIAARLGCPAVLGAVVLVFWLLAHYV